MKDFEFVFNPEEIKRKKKYNDPSLNLFYIDEIQDKLRNLTTDNLKKRKEIINKQNYTLKNMTYYGYDIPSRWKVNSKYNKNVFSMIKKDKQFVDYLMNTDNTSEVSTQDSKKSYFADLVEEKKQKINKPESKKVNKYDLLPSLKTQENKDSSVSPIKENFNDSNNYTVRHKTVSFNATTNFFNKAKNERSHSSLNNIDISTKNTHMQFYHKPSFLYPKPTMRDFNKTSSKVLSFEKDLLESNKIKSVKKEIEEAPSDKAKSKTTLFNSTFNYFSKNSHSTLNNFFKRNLKNESEIKVGNLLNVDYDGLFKKKVNIHNNELKTKWEKVDHYGPKYAHCNTCFNKNLEFFEKINPKDGVNIINFIETTKNFYDLNN